MSPRRGSPSAARPPDQARQAQARRHDVSVADDDQVHRPADYVELAIDEGSELARGEPTVGIHRLGDPAVAVNGAFHIGGSRRCGATRADRADCGSRRRGRRRPPGSAGSAVRSTGSMRRCCPGHCSRTRRPRGSHPALGDAARRVSRRDDGTGSFRPTLLAAPLSGSVGQVDDGQHSPEPLREPPVVVAEQSHG